MTVEIDDSKLRAALQSLGRELSDPSEALDDIGARLADQIRARLKLGIQYDGVPMEPLKAATLKRSGKGRISPVPLNDTRTHIHKRINHQLEGRDTVAVGMIDGEAPIGLTHQFGSPKKGIPARPFIPINPAGNVDLPREWEDDVMNAITTALRDALK